MLDILWELLYIAALVYLAIALMDVGVSFLLNNEKRGKARAKHYATLKPIRALFK